MKVIVVSDNHRDVEILKEIVRKHPADLYLHAGDSVLVPEMIAPFVSVRGNCDIYPYDLHRTFEIGQYKIYMTHGHLFSKARLIKNAKTNGCQVAICGHTHVPSIEEVDGLYVINPGSISFPRMDHDKTYIEMDLAEDIQIRILKV